MTALLEVQRTRNLFPALTDDEYFLTDKLLNRLSRVSIRNALRSRYYDAEQTVQHLGIAIPPQLEDVETVIGWPAKAVDDLEQRIDLEGFVIPGLSWSDVGLDVIWDENQLGLEASQAHTSALKYCTSFVAVLKGGEVGQPDVIVRPLSARTTTALWDSVRRRVDTAVTVTDVTETGDVTEFILFTSEAVITMYWDGAKWLGDREPHGLGRAPVAVLPFKPSLEAPFGKSRLTRAVMSITDRAIRSLLRMEVSAEFYSSPQRYVLGADESAFKGADGQTKTGWEVTLGKVLALGVDPDSDEKPSVGQFPQLTMQPHMDMVRSDAALFAGETGIPVNSLGIIHDNPASEAAMQTAYLPLVKTAERAATPFGIGWVDVMRLAVQVRDGLRQPPAELSGMRAKFRNPATVTKAAAADATIKFVQAFPWSAESEVALEMFGVDRIDIDRLLADKRRAQVGSLLGNLRGQAVQAVADPVVAAIASDRGVSSDNAAAGN